MFDALLNILWDTLLLMLAIGFIARLIGSLEQTSPSQEATARGSVGSSAEGESVPGSERWRQNETIAEVSAAAQPVQASAVQETASVTETPASTEPSAPSETAEQPAPTVTTETPAIAPHPTEVEELQELDLPLAASLRVSEAIHPTAVGDVSIELPDLTDSPMTSNAVSEHHDRPNLLQEIAQLDEADYHQQIAQLAQYVGHPDHTARAAAVVTLGDLAKRSQGSDREAAIALLNQFIHDADDNVRVRAAAALGEMPVVG